MQQHAVPQNVTSFEFKIVGFLTLKQFGMLAICGIFAFVSFIYIQNYIAKVAFTLFFAGLGALLAFGSVQNIPFYRWIFIFIQAIFSPTQRIWIKTATAPAYMTAAYAVEAVQARVIEDRTVLSSYLQTLPNQKRTSLDVLENQKLQSLSLNQSGPAVSTIVQPQAPLSHTPLMSRSSPPPIPADSPKPKKDEEPTPLVTPPIKNEQHISQSTIVPMQPKTSPFDNKPMATQSPVQQPKPIPPVSVTPPPIPAPPVQTKPIQPLPSAGSLPVQSKTPATQPTVPIQPAAPKIQNMPPMPTPAKLPEIKPASPPPKITPAVVTPIPAMQSKPEPVKTQVATIAPAPVTPPPIQTPPIVKPVEPVPVKEVPVQPAPKLWSTIQGIEREFLQELRQMRESDEKEKNELKARLAEIERKQQDLELQKQSELKQKETEMSAQKDAEIKLLQEQFDKQRLEIEAKQSEKTKEEEKYLQEMQQKLDEEKAKRELFEKNNAEITNHINLLLQEKADLEISLNNKQNAPLPDSAENEKMKEKVNQLNAEIEKLNTEITSQVEQEKTRKSQEGGKLQEELAAQKKAFEQEKLLLENEKKVIANERTALKQQTDEIVEQKKKLQELELELQKRQQTLEAANKKTEVQQQQKSDSLEQLADQLQKETDIFASSKKPEGIRKSESLIIPKAEKPASRPSLAKEKTTSIVTELETANIPQITNLVNVINGVVYDANGNLVPNVIIIVKDTEKTPVRALKSNRLGQFAISTPLPNGTYTMEFEDSKEERTFNVYQITLSGSVVPPIAISERT